MFVSMPMIRNIFYIPIPTCPAILAFVFLKPRWAIMSYSILFIMNS